MNPMPDTPLVNIILNLASLLVTAWLIQQQRKTQGKVETAGQDARETKANSEVIKQRVDGPLTMMEQRMKRVERRLKRIEQKNQPPEKPPEK
jgi:Flp pilus assembly protein TadB